MGRDRKRFNVKGRQIGTKSVTIDDTATKQIAVDTEVFEKGKYDESNALALPSKKRKTRVLRDDQGSGKKLLSKKQRKKLQLIVSRREKKSGRAELLEELQKHQLTPETFAKLTPLVKVQTEGLKKLFAANKAKEREDEKELQQQGSAIDSEEEFQRVEEKKKTKKRFGNNSKPKSSIKGANKMKFRSWSGRFTGEIKAVDKEDPKVLGLDISYSSSDADDTDEETEEVAIKEEVDDNDDDNDLKMEEACDEENSSSSSSDIEMKDEPQPQAEKVSTKVEPAASSSKNVEPKKLLTKEKSEVEVVGVRVTKSFVSVHRTKAIEAVRAKLPIIAEEQQIMESISENLVTVLAGETGSGKTTQVPQFLYEAGFTLNGKIIGVTEPRRVAAISMSHRVAQELNVSTDVVSYQIRFEGNVSKKTQIKFMTDGVLLKEMEKDFLLTKYSAICIDEAHERSLYTDILIGLLSRCVLIRMKRNDPLKLVIMSATMRVSDFVENSILFKTPPRLIHVPTRQFPVQIHFSKVTPQNYLLAAFKKIIQIHKKLPTGGILVFVTGQQEVRTLINQLKRVCPSIDGKSVAYKKRETMKGKKPKLKGAGVSGVVGTKSSTPSLVTFDLDRIKTMPLKGDEEEEDSDSDDLSDEDDELRNGNGDDWNVEGIDESTEPLHVLPLYSMLPSKDQQKVFEPAPAGSRLCVISTNVAETSLTIPSVRYVVDCGKVKLKMWDKLTGVQQFKICWESKASAEQRAGRAGRTGPGHCYRLFSSALFDSDFEQYSAPEIQVRPVDDMMLLMKSMSIDKVANFPYPSHPGETQLIAAEKTLLALGALEQKKPSVLDKSKSDNANITQLGRTMAHFPLGPRFSKMLALSFNYSLVEYAIALVSALTVQEVFLDASVHETSKGVKANWAVIRRKWAGTGSLFLLGDCMVLLRAVGAFEYEGGTPEFCVQKGLRFKAMNEIRKLRKQLTSEVNLVLNEGEEVPLNPQMSPPTEEQSILLRQIVLSGLPDRIARKIHESEIKEGEDPKVYKHAYRCGELEDPVFIHTSSVLRAAQPDWLVYQQLFESNGKMYLQGVTAIEPSWIPIFCKTLCKTENPLKDPPPFYDQSDGLIKCSVKATYGRQGWELPIVEVEYPMYVDKFKLFAQFLLEGQIFPKFAEWKSRLLSLPVTMVKSWAKLQPRTQTLLAALTSNGIHRKSDLITMWEENEEFLLKEYLEWIPQDLQSQVSLAWPPVS